MRISAFTIARNTVSIGYPLAESIRSLLPLVDEYVVAVGDCDDGTWEVVQGIGDPRIRAFRTTWDLSLGQGLMLSEETNRALAECRGDWAVYLQADEVLHERDLPALRAALERYRRTPVEALSFRYLHFYGSYDLVQRDPRRFYRRATRVVRPGTRIASVGDACAFEVRDGAGWRRPRRVDLPLSIYHYGWVQPPAALARRMANAAVLWTGEELDPAAFDGAAIVARGTALAVPYRGSHPAVMQARVAAQDWTYPRPRQTPLTWLRRAGSYAGWGWDALRRRL